MSVGWRTLLVLILPSSYSLLGVYEHSEQQRQPNLECAREKKKKAPLVSLSEKRKGSHLLITKKDKHGMKIMIADERKKKESEACP
ncbi:MAG: hypothetical protein J3R72DRAFT_438746 [Linnemannia gamsii]|nr:MAG: hypothetical protein J3R72DRAFT_438746 [Linnemannia gamsii]